MSDPTENIRRVLVAAINHAPGSREALEAKHGKVWDMGEMTEDFSVSHFAAPFILVTRKSDRVTGSLTFQHSPRFYFDFRPDGGAK